MDPQACFSSFLREVHYDHAKLLMDSYNEWVAKGGFKAIDADGKEVEKLKIQNSKRCYSYFSGGQIRWIKI